MTGGYMIGRITQPGVETPSTAVVSGDAFALLGPEADDVNRLFGDLASWEERIGAALQGELRPLSEVRVEAPVAPRQLIQGGANYRKHVIDLAVAHAAPDGDLAEVRAAAEREMDQRAAFGLPFLFTGLPTAIASTADPLSLPAWSDAHDWELELAAVIGAPAFRVGPDEALSHVVGYTIVNDITTRDAIFPKGAPATFADWFRAKNSPGFFPTGPFVTPAQFVADPQSLALRLEVNGVVRQDESTADMVHGVAQLVSAASQITRLLPGDLILTGSPAGNGMHYGIALRDGDVMVGSITGLGAQTIRCVAG
ncbi:fumarylacetoacetate hydrolase family protein [Microbacterium album]|uniref:Hydrolase n=1 Tax=Microbacterium album TaxID=2053191 RepID=A0A917MPG2_9MICO|nr:fumarylacetoacetate hydrolase family protein [Microbacterium album]GGH47242.1 hydrolase [Microbacterium album]